MIIYIIEVVLYLGVVYGLFQIARNIKWLHYLVNTFLALPILFSAYLFFPIWILGVVAIERLGSMVAQYRAAGEDELVWFYLLQCPLVWILYRLVNLR